jgi:signal transduction histidine kinase/ligand-binding sensor domain-containing protein/DNA-binding response OmpR family regulator
MSSCQQLNSKALFIFYLCTIGLASSYAQTITFKHLTVENGLSNNKVNTIIQDKAGFIWFGTEDGLNRFDGYNFKVYRHDPSDSNSLSNNSIWALLEDNKGNIWIGTKDGTVNIFNPDTEIFIQITPQPKLKDWNSITALYEDKSSNIWIGTRSAGVYKYNPKSGKFNHWLTDSLSTNSLSHFSVRSIIQDQQGNIIVGTYKGLNKLDPEYAIKEIKKYFHEINNANSLSSSQIYNLTRSSLNPEIIWIGTPTGLHKFNSGNDSITRIKIPNKEKLQFGAGASTVIEEIIDGQEIIWTDTYSGLLRINHSTGSFNRFTENPNDPGSIINNQINKIIKDRSGVIWIATENGISYYTPKSTRFNSPFDENVLHYLHASNNRNNLRAAVQENNKNVWLGFSDGLISIVNSTKDKTIKSNTQFDKLNVWCLSSDSANSLWIGTYGQGLKQFDLNSGKQKDWELNYKRTNKKTVPFIKSLFTDSKNNLWIGYWGSGLGFINILNGTTQVWSYEIHNRQSLNFQDVWSINEDRFGRIWVATPGGGLNIVKDINNDVFDYWVYSENDTNSISSNSVFTICVAKNYDTLINKNLTVLWVGTNNGLNKFSVIHKENNPYDFNIDIKYFTKKDGLPDNNVNSILEDDDGNLWLGTSSGISFLDVRNKTFTNFSLEDGLNGTMFNLESALRLDNELMIFGSTKGLNIFDPEKIKLSDYKPPIVITDFQIFNEPVSISEASPLKKSILITDEIILPHDKHVFSFEFAALDFNSPSSIKYAYKMEGFDADWIISGDRRFASYTNLDPGTYTFMVKATNADDVWSDEYTSINIIVNPPWWQTTWAFLLYALLIGLGLFAIRRFELNLTELRNELKMQQFEAEQKTKLEAVKSRFFANLSHEFRTPLMLIKGPLEQLKDENTNDNFRENINLIERNSERLKDLIDQLLELSHLEKETIPLKAKQENLVDLLKGLVSSFDSLEKQKNISFIFNSDSDSKICWVDYDKFEKIINNLLSNAFKFTSRGGKVEVIIKNLTLHEKNFSEIVVKDNGVGIPKGKVDKIFDRFYQVDDSSQRSYGGSGIGLALVKEFVDRHKWDISVESEPGKGTEFKLKIPMWDYLKDDEKLIGIKYKEIDSKEIKKDEKNNFQSVFEYPEESKSTDPADKASILIVDDSDDVRKYLRILLKNDFEILQASNGESGIKTAADEIPDLIISDIMMPSMDGIEFCRRIKSEWQTSHIPVILLTAKASFESKLEGLEIGADDYLTKPFESRELFVRIKNLLNQRKKLKEKFAKDFKNILVDKKINTPENEFISKAYSIVEKNLNSTIFNTEQLAKKLFVSRTQLHRKISTISGMAPGEFIRSIKLKKAAELIIENKLSVTQIAYEVGFGNPSQFTRAFRKHFNCLPSEYSSRVNSINPIKP